MSNYSTVVVSRLTGEKYKVDCLDNYFGPHQYGYRVRNLTGSEGPLTENEFEQQFEPVK